VPCDVAPVDPNSLHGLQIELLPRLIRFDCTLECVNNGHRPSHSISGDVSLLEATARLRAGSDNFRLATIRRERGKRHFRERKALPIKAELLKNEFGSGCRCHLGQFLYSVIALAVDLNHLMKSSFRFGEVLFSFAVSFINFFPRRSKEDNWPISVLPTRV
jgi:hypothetical protein